MKTAEEIIKEECIPPGNICPLFTKAEVIKVAEKYASQSKWISVEEKEKLPEYGAYLVAEYDNWIVVAGIHEGEWRTIDGNNLIKPTHWMPLPAPPEK